MYVYCIYCVRVRARGRWCVCVCVCVWVYICTCTEETSCTTTGAPAPRHAPPVVSSVASEPAEAPAASQIWMYRSRPPLAIRSLDPTSPYSKAYAGPCGINTYNSLKVPCSY